SFTRCDTPHALTGLEVDEFLVQHVHAHVVGELLAAYFESNGAATTGRLCGDTVDGFEDPELVSPNHRYIQLGGGLDTGSIELHGSRSIFVVVDGVVATGDWLGGGGIFFDNVGLRFSERMRHEGLDIIFGHQRCFAAAIEASEVVFDASAQMFGHLNSELCLGD